MCLQNDRCRHLVGSGTSLHAAAGICASLTHRYLEEIMAERGLALGAALGAGVGPAGAARTETHGGSWRR
jgi:hypothetical protein